MRNCNDCDVPLIVGENWTAGRKANGTNICSRCNSIRNGRTPRRQGGQKWQGYDNDHARVSVARGYARRYQCKACPKQAYDWALIHGRDPIDINSYIPLCRSCHVLYDLGNELPERVM